jgi:small subunit ribosomal protein S6
MRQYELMVILDPETEERTVDKTMDKFLTVVKNDGGTVENVDIWGRRRLAYEIDHKGEGIYHLLFFTAPPATLAEITRVLKITDGVMRHLAVRRVKGGQRTAPPQPPAPAQAAVAAGSAPADDAVAGGE